MEGSGALSSRTVRTMGNMSTKEASTALLRKALCVTEFNSLMGLFSAPLILVFQALGYSIFFSR